MAFGRHIMREPEKKPLAKTQTEKKPEVKTKEPEKKEEIKVIDEPEEIKKLEPKKRVYTDAQKKRKLALRKEKRETSNDLSLTGNTVAAKDFRAIIKKQGKKINIVLNDLVHEWNQKNYNL